MIYFAGLRYAKMAVITMILPLFGSVVYARQEPSLPAGLSNDQNQQAQPA